MSTLKDLFSLQELDLELASIDGQKAEAERELGTGVTLEKLEKALHDEGVKLKEFRTRMRVQRVEADIQRERASDLEGRLYDGQITSPRDLKSLEEEVANVKGMLDQQDNELLDISIQIEESQKKHGEMERQFAETKSKWAARESELTQLVTRLTSEREGLAGRRQELADTVESAALRQYENLRRSKGGVAVAKVERGLCQACRMALPTRHLQQVRAGRETVLCSTCGRILLPT